MPVRPTSAEGICFPDPAQTLLLRAALLEGDAAREAFREWRARVDPEALDEGSYRMLPLLSKNLLRLGLTDAYLDRWKGTRRRSFVVNEILFRELGPVLDALGKAGIPVLLLKGAALVAGVYGESGLRPMADLDLLVPDARARDAFETLRALGWRSLAPRPERLLDARHGTSFKGPSGHEIDLHWYLLWENCAREADAPLWEAAVEARLGARAVRIPCAADQLLHVVVHGLQWSPLPPLRWAADAFLLVASDAMDWDRLAREASRRSLTLPVRTGLRWVRERLEAAVPADALARLDAAPVSRAERSELAAKWRPMNGIASLEVHWAHHRRRSSAHGLGALATLGGFPAYLQHNWGVDRLFHLPYEIIRRGLRRLWIDWVGAGRPAIASRSQS